MRRHYDQNAQNCNTSPSSPSELLPLCQYVKELPSPGIPQYFPHNHPSTLWLLSNLTSDNGLRRIFTKNRDQEFLSSRYFQMADNPSYYMQSKLCQSERPAFNNNSILYMTPIAIAVYLKLNRALDMMLKSGKFSSKEKERFVSILNRSELIVSNTSGSSEISNFTIFVLAVLRMNVEALIIFMNYELFDPHAEFVLVKKKFNNETVYYYRDILDFMIYQLRKRPCLPVGIVIQQLINVPWKIVNSNNSYQLNSHGYNVNVFEKPLVSTESTTTDHCISVIRRILLLTLEQEYFAREVGGSILNVIETLVKATHLNMKYCDNNNKDRSSALRRTPMLLAKMNVFSDIAGDYSEELFCKDIMKCIGLLIRWYQNCTDESREAHCNRIVSLITRILLDNHLLHILYEEKDEVLMKKFSSRDGIGDRRKTKIFYGTFKDMRMRIFEIIRNSSHLKRQFLKLYNNSKEDGKYDGKIANYSTGQTFNDFAISNSNQERKKLSCDKNENSVNSNHTRSKERLGIYGKNDKFAAATFRRSSTVIKYFNNFNNSNEEDNACKKVTDEDNKKIYETSMNGTNCNYTVTLDVGQTDLTISTAGTQIGVVSDSITASKSN